MPLVTLKEILAGTREGHYAVGGFNFYGYDDAQGMIDGAVEKRSPVILMASLGACRYIGLKQTVGMVRGMAESVDIPVCLHLDHATDYDYIKAAVRAGFTSVMVDASALDYETNIRDSRAIVDFAKSYHCSVEAELGKVGGKEEHVAVDDRTAAFTDPRDVPRYVEETGIDALAIAFGSVHGLYKSEPKLD
jgi:ketose-bisphosphate aldolase